MNEFGFVSRVFSIIVLLVSNFVGAPAPDARCNIDFQILIDRTTYSPGEKMHVKFLVTNTSDAPLYFFRGLSRCSSQLGSYLLLILDENRHEANRSGCSSDLLMEKLDVVGILTAPESGMMLKPGEIYGTTASFELPAKKGLYRLKAELIPAAFTSEQKETLSRKDIRVLQERCAAPVVIITIK